VSKRILNIIFILAVGMVGGIFSAQILTPRFFDEDILSSDYLAKIVSGPVYLTEKKDITVEENTALQDSIEKVEDSIIGVKTVTLAGKTIYGSGLILTTDGLVVTLNNLIPSKGEFTFYVNGKAQEYQILKRDSKNNLALIKIDGNNLKPCAFSDFSNIKIGQRVFLLGLIFSGNERQFSANEGIVETFNQEYIATNMLEDKSLAGSSLFNIGGELMGLNTIDSGGEVTAVPINKIKDFVGY
jgi:S1-C subfamily serine protease